MGTGQPKPSIGYLRVICTEKNTHTLVRDKPERERVCCSATRLVQPVPGRDREINTITHQQASTNTTTQPPKTTQSPLQETEAVGTGQPKPSIGYLRVICTEKNTHTLVRDKPERERVCCSATRLVQPVPGRDREINTITHQQASTNTTTQPPNRVPFRTEAVGTGQPKPSTPTGKHKHYNPATKDYTESPSGD